jgi:lipid-binding SYLF domain-containing protein
MNKSGKNKLLSSRFTLGGDAAVAGGPVGRSAQAQTDAQMRAEILSYSRSRGVFAGVSLEGATLRQDADDNEELYGKPVTPNQILDGELAPPETVQPLMAALNRYSRHEH